MLVLSRRQNQKVVFPNLGISVEVLRISGNQIRLGIDAPPDVTVLRQEIAGTAAERPHRPETLTDDLASRLAAASLELKKLYRRLQEGPTQDAEQRVLGLLHALQAMNDEVVGGHQPLRPGSGPRRALLVDDNSNETQLLAGFLRCRRFDVATAEDGASALQFLGDNERPDFVLLDMNMPKFDGRWTIDRIRQNPRFADLKVFGVSGMHPAEYGVEVGPRGIDRWFRKPVDPESLVLEMLAEEPPPVAAESN